MIDTSWIVWMDNLYWLAFTFILMNTVYFGHAISLGDFKPSDNPVAIDPHGADMDNMAFSLELHHCQQNVQSALSVVCESVVDVRKRFH
jgi:hypothetical protein